MRPLLACATLLGAIGLSSVTRAQELNYQTFIVGERALGMGGAFTGVADDPSASYYNPAGVAQIESSTLSGSLQVNAFDRYEVHDGYGSPVGTSSLVHEGSPTVPLFVGLVKKFGPRDDDRVRRHAVALSTIHPQSVRRRFDVTLTNPDTNVHTSLRVTHADRTRWYGPSYGYRISPDLALGLSGFLVTRQMTHDENQVINTLGERDPDGVFRNATVFVRESTVELDATSILFRVGVLWNATDRWRLGLMLQPPGIPISNGARVFERRTAADLLADPPSATFFHSDQSGLDAESPTPWEIRAGASYSHGDAFTAAFDVSVYGPVGSEDDPIHAIGDANPEPITGDVPQPGDLAVTDYHSELTFNLSLGVETVIADAVPLRAGVFTDFSAAPSIDGPTDRYAPASLDGWGASLSVGIRSEGYDIAVGAAGLLSLGRGLRLNPDPGSVEAPETYLPTDVEARAIYVFISGAKRAASRLARNVYEEYIRPEDQLVE